MHRLSWTARRHVARAITLAERETREFANRKGNISSHPAPHYPLLAAVRPDGVRMRVGEYVATFRGLEPRTTLSDRPVHVLEGKVVLVRRLGRGMLFVDLVQDRCKVQLVAMNRMMELLKEAFAEAHADLKPGDHVCAAGAPGTTATGELSLKLTQPVRVAVPALHPIPPKLTDRAKIRSHRVVDYLVNPQLVQRIATKLVVMGAIRLYFAARGFLEVQTPILGPLLKGANATPFTTHLQHVKEGDVPVELHLRVAPELWLKRLTTAGFDKVFEIGQVFRNEGIDRTHNPEFTSCEFYQSWADLEELMAITEQLVAAVLETVAAALPAAVSEQTRGFVHQLQTTLGAHGGAFNRVEFIPAIERLLGRPLPHPLTQEALAEYCSGCGVEVSPHALPIQLLDALSEHYLEPLCQDRPTFIYHQPAIMLPLAKQVQLTYGDRSYAILKRFEMYLHQQELVNAYEEENLPFQQAANFRHQQELRERYHDEEMLVPDHQYVAAMEWGLPPTGGWGMGVDRFVAMLTASERLEEVLTFGDLGDVVKQ